MKLIKIAGDDRVAVHNPPAEFLEQIRLADQSRKEAKELLDQWAQQSLYVQLNYRPGDIRIVGKLICLEGGDYLFRFSSGISTRIFLLTYDEISVETRYADVPYISLRNSDGDELTLSLLRKRPPTAEEFDTVYHQLRDWVRSEAPLIVHIGDDLRSTVMTCKVTESNSGIFSFRGVNVDLAHSVDPSQAGSFRIEHCYKWTQITAYTHNTNLFFSAADGDLMEDIIAKGRYRDGKNALQWCAETKFFK